MGSATVNGVNGVSPRPWSSPAVHRGEALSVHRDGLAGRVQLHSGCGLGGILNHTNVAWAGDTEGQGQWTPLPCPTPITAPPAVTFVGSLGDAYGLADEFVVSPAPAPAHATAGAAKAAMLTWEESSMPRLCQPPAHLPSSWLPQPSSVQKGIVPSAPPHIPAQPPHLQHWGAWGC